MSNEIRFLYLSYPGTPDSQEDLSILTRGTHLNVGEDGFRVYKRIGEKSDIHAIAKEQFPNADSYTELAYNFDKIDDLDNNDLKFDIDRMNIRGDFGTTYYRARSVIYRPEDDRFLVRVRSGTIFDMGVDQVALDPVTHKPFFVCPATTAFHGGEFRGDQLFKREQLNELARDRGIPSRQIASAAKLIAASSEPTDPV